MTQHTDAQLEGTATMPDITATFEQGDNRNPDGYMILRVPITPHKIIWERKGKPIVTKSLYNNGGHPKSVAINNMALNLTVKANLPNLTEKPVEGRQKVSLAELMG